MRLGCKLAQTTSKLEEQTISNYVNNFFLACKMQNVYLLAEVKHSDNQLSFYQ